MRCRAAHCMAGHLKILTSRRPREFCVFFLEERIHTGQSKRRRKSHICTLVFEKENRGFAA